MKIGKSLKSFFGSRVFDSNLEKISLTVLSNFGFGETNLKRIVEEGYNSNTYVYSIINRIAESGADIPIIIEATNSKGDIELITEGDFYNFVHRPNPHDNYKTLTYKSLVYLLSCGNLFQYGVKPFGASYYTETSNLAAQFIEAKTTETIMGVMPTAYKYKYGEKDYTPDVDDVLHVKKINIDPSKFLGLSPLQAAWRTLAASNEVITADASLIKNRGAMGLLTSKKERPLTEEERKQTQKALKKRIGGGDKYGSIGVTSGQFDFIKFAMSPVDLQILENGVMKLRDLCSVFGVSSRMFNDPGAAAFNNLKEDVKRFYNDGVLPPLENYIDNFNRFYTEGWNECDNVTYKLRLDISKIDALQQDQLIEVTKSTRRSAIITKILEGITTNKWSRQSAIEQLMDALSMTEEEAEKLVDVQPENNNDNEQ